MIKNVGIWIDHRNAVIVSITDRKEETRFISTELEKYTQFSSGSSKMGAAGEPQDSQFHTHLNAYYDEVIQSAGEADALLIFGPGNSKDELAARLHQTHPNGYIIRVETTDKMTSRQIADKVKHHFFVNA